MKHFVSDRTRAQTRQIKDAIICAPLGVSGLAAIAASGIVAPLFQAFVSPLNFQGIDLFELYLFVICVPFAGPIWLIGNLDWVEVPLVDLADQVTTWPIIAQSRQTTRSLWLALAFDFHDEIVVA